MAGGLLPGCSIKLVNWEEGSYQVTDWPHPRGEIHVSGANVAMGYFNQPEKVSEDFYIDNKGVRWFRTGDIGEFDSQGLLKVMHFISLYQLILTCVFIFRSDYRSQKGLG